MRKTSTIATLFICATLLTGCAMDTPKPAALNLDCTSITEVLPPFGQATSAHIGDELITSICHREFETIHIHESVGIGLPITRWTVRPGIYEKCGPCNEFTIYKVSNKDGGGKVKCHVIAPDPTYIAINKSSNRIGIVTQFTFRDKNGQRPAYGPITETSAMPKHEYKIAHETEKSQTGSTLIYNGATANTIILTYKAYPSNDKQALTPMIFDISKSKTIQYKEHRIEVIHADNKEIIYQRTECNTQESNNNEIKINRPPLA